MSALTFFSSPFCLLPTSSFLMSPSRPMICLGTKVVTLVTPLTTSPPTFTSGPTTSASRATPSVTVAATSAAASLNGRAASRTSVPIRDEASVSRPTSSPIRRPSLMSDSKRRTAAFALAAARSDENRESSRPRSTKASTAPTAWSTTAPNAFTPAAAGLPTTGISLSVAAASRDAALNAPRWSFRAKDCIPSPSACVRRSSFSNPSVSCFARSSVIFSAAAAPTVMTTAGPAAASPPAAAAPASAARPVSPAVARAAVAGGRGTVASAPGGGAGGVEAADGPAGGGALLDPNEPPLGVDGPAGDASG